MVDGEVVMAARKAKRRTFRLGAVLIVGVLGALFIFAALRSEKETPSPIPRNAPAFTELWDEMAEMTPARQEAYLQQLSGSIADWTGWVNGVEEAEVDTYQVWVDMVPAADYGALRGATFYTDEDALVLLPSQRVRVSGEIRCCPDFSGQFYIRLMHVTVNSGEATAERAIRARTSVPQPADPGTEARVMIVDWMDRPVPDKPGYVYVEGIVRNVGNTSATFVKVRVRCVDAQGKLVARESCCAKPDEIRPGDDGTFQAIIKDDPNIEAFEVMLRTD